MALHSRKIALLSWHYVQCSKGYYSRNYAGIMCQPPLLSPQEYFCYLNKLSGNNGIDSQDHRRYVVEVLRVAYKTAICRKTTVGRYIPSKGIPIDVCQQLFHKMSAVFNCNNIFL